MTTHPSIFRVVARWFGVHIHSWSSWDTIGQGRIVDNGAGIGRFVIQQRTCTECGKVKLEEHKAVL
jgi:hypothetical protein